MPIRIIERENRIEECEGGIDLGERRARGATTGSGHEGDRFPDVTHDSLGEDRPAVVQELHTVHDPGGSEVGRGQEDGVVRCAAAAPTHALDVCVRVRAAERRAEPEAGDFEVVAVTRLSRDFCDPVGPWRGRADDGNHAKRDYKPRETTA